MVAVVTNEDRSFAGTVAQMIGDRKMVFAVDDISHRRDAAVYLVAQDTGTGARLGSVQLVETTALHARGNDFACLCNGPVPRGPGVREITLSISPGLKAQRASAIRAQLALGLMEYALAEGIESCTMITPVAELPTLLAVGWDLEPLGLPMMMSGEMVGALQIAVSAAALDRLRSVHGFERVVQDAPRHSSAQVA